MAQLSSMPENSRRKRKVWVAALAVGLVIGLGFGIITSVAFVLPRMTSEAILGFAINPVRVSGTVSGVQEGSIQFVNENEGASTRYGHRVQIVDGNYSIVLSGGYLYKVYVGIGGLTGALYTFSLYVPADVATFTANYPP